MLAKPDLAKLCTYLLAREAKPRDMPQAIGRMTGDEPDMDRIYSAIRYARDHNFIREVLDLPQGDIDELQALYDNDPLKKELKVSELHVVPDELFAPLAAEAIGRDFLAGPVGGDGFPAPRVAVTYGSDVAAVCEAIGRRFGRTNERCQIVAARGEPIGQPLGATSSSHIAQTLAQALQLRQQAVTLTAVPAAVPAAALARGFAGGVPPSTARSVLIEYFRRVSPGALMEASLELAPIAGLLTSCGRQVNPSATTLGILSSAGALAGNDTQDCCELAGCVFCQPNCDPALKGRVEAHARALIGLAEGNIRQAFDARGSWLVASHATKANQVLRICRHGGLVSKIVLSASCSARIWRLVRPISPP